MTIVMAIQKWRHYLLGRHFAVLIDQKGLKFLTEHRIMSEEYFRWTGKENWDSFSFVLSI